MNSTDEEEGSDTVEEDENETSDGEQTSDESESPYSSEDEETNDVIPLNVATDPTLIKIRLLITQARKLIALIRRTFLLHEYVQQEKQKKGLSGDVSN